MPFFHLLQGNVYTIVAQVKFKHELKTQVLNVQKTRLRDAPCISMRYINHQVFNRPLSIFSSPSLIRTMNVPNSSLFPELEKNIISEFDLVDRECVCCCLFQRWTF